MPKTSAPNESDAVFLRKCLDHYAATHPGKKIRVAALVAKLTSGDGKAGDLEREIARAAADNYARHNPREKGACKRLRSLMV